MTGTHVTVSIGSVMDRSLSRLRSARRSQPRPATYLFEAVAVGGAIKTGEVKAVRLAAGGTSHDNHLVAGPQRLGRHSDVRQLATVVQLDPPLLRGATRLPDFERDEGVRIDELELRYDALHPDVTAAVVHAGDRVMRFGCEGLDPPTPEEVDAFLKDDSPDAYEKVVDRLLASPHYGERWARHWLDLARFAESHGFEHDYDRPHGVPLPRLRHRGAQPATCRTTRSSKWQIAGDEFAPDNPLALMATGFLAAGVHSTQITENEVEKHRYDELDDMLGTIGTAMLGLTIGCARCHDHKFDPIPHARLLPAALDVHDDGPQRGRPATSTRTATRRRRRRSTASTAHSRTRWRSSRRTSCPAKFAAWRDGSRGQGDCRAWVVCRT